MNFRVWLSLLLGLFLVLTGCASTHRIAKPELEIKEDRLFGVVERLNQHEREIRQLQAEIDALNHLKEVAEEKVQKMEAAVAAAKLSPLDLATQKLEQGNYREAIRLAREFLNEKPKDPAADRAQWILMESHFQNQEYNLVIVDTNLLETRYPQSTRLPEALYRRGVALAELGQKERSQEAMQSLVKRFPKSALSQLAMESMLNEQSKNSPPLMVPKP